jgi:hypothetical protein
MYFYKSELKSEKSLSLSLCNEFPKIFISLHNFSNTRLFKHFADAVDLSNHNFGYSGLKELEKNDFPKQEKLFINDLINSYLKTEGAKIVITFQ